MSFEDWKLFIYYLENDAWSRLNHIYLELSTGWGYE